MRKAVITIMPDNEAQRVDVQTGGVTNLEMLDNMKTLSEFFSKELVDEFMEHRGYKVWSESYNQEFSNYIKFLRTNKV